MRTLTVDLNRLRNDLSDVLGSEDKECINEFVQKYIGGVDTKEEMRNIACTVVAILQDLCSDADIFYIKAISDFESVLDLQEMLYNIILRAKELLGKKRLNNQKYITIADEIKKVINEEYSAIENVTQITDMLGISSRHANKIFKSIEDVTIFDYLIKVRIKKAKELLEDPYYKVYEVAEKVGYRSSAYFAVIFKRIVGVTPDNYRKKAQKNHIEI